MRMAAALPPLCRILNSFLSAKKVGFEGGWGAVMEGRVFCWVFWWVFCGFFAGFFGFFLGFLGFLPAPGVFPSLVGRGVGSPAAPFV